MYTHLKAEGYISNEFASKNISASQYCLLLIVQLTISVHFLYVVENMREKSLDMQRLLSLAKAFHFIDRILTSSALAMTMAGYIFKCILINEVFCILFLFLLGCILNGSIENEAEH